MAHFGGGPNQINNQMNGILSQNDIVRITMQLRNQGKSDHEINATINQYAQMIANHQIQFQQQSRFPINSTAQQQHQQLIQQHQMQIKQHQQQILNQQHQQILNQQHQQRLQKIKQQQLLNQQHQQRFQQLQQQQQLLANKHQQQQQHQAMSMGSSSFNNNLYSKKTFGSTHSMLKGSNNSNNINNINNMNYIKSNIPKTPNVSHNNDIKYSTQIISNRTNSGGSSGGNSNGNRSGNRSNRSNITNRNNGSGNRNNESNNSNNNNNGSSNGNNNHGNNNTNDNSNDKNKNNDDNKGNNNDNNDKNSNNGRKIIRAKSQLIRVKTVWVVGKTKPFAEEYLVGKMIGTPGQYGKALRCKKKKDPLKGEINVVKCISKEKLYRIDKDSNKRVAYLMAMQNEIQIMQIIQHPNIIKFKGVHEDKHTLFLVMEECKGGELFDMIKKKKRFTEIESKIIMKQILEAIFYMHDTHRIGHFDLKPDNILFKRRQQTLEINNFSKIKIIDFGMSQIVKKKKRLTQVCGTPYYCAPEVIQGI